MPRGQTRDPKKPEFYDWNHEAKDEHGNHKFPVGTRRHHVGREEFHYMHRSTSLYGKDRGEAHKKAAEAHAKVQTLKGKNLHADHPLVHAAMAATKKAEAADHKHHQMNIQKGIERHKHMVKAAANPKHKDHEKAKKHMKDFHDIRKAAASPDNHVRIHAPTSHDKDEHGFIRLDHRWAKHSKETNPKRYGDHLMKIKEDLDADPQSMDNRRLSVIARNPNHPLHTHAKSELDRRKMKNEGVINEDGHSDVPSAIRGCKTTMEDAMQIMKKLQSMSGEDSLPSWWTNKLAVASNSMNKLRDYIMTPSNMEEKTLTPAEIRKRDKIAKAIKKDDPDMPMDKKMAIATATAKRVAEGKVDEISSKTLSNYMRKSTASAGKPGASTRTQDKRIGGQKMADDKLRKMDGKGSAAKVAATSEAKVDEISMGKMQAYGKAAAKDIDQKRNKVKAALDQPASVKHAKDGMKAMQGLTKRSKGSDMYVNKMTGRSKVKPTFEDIMTMINKNKK